MYSTSVYTLLQDVITLNAGSYALIANSTGYQNYIMQTVVYNADLYNQFVFNDVEENAFPVGNRAVQANIHNSTNFDYYRLDIFNDTIVIDIKNG